MTPIKITAKVMVKAILLWAVFVEHACGEQDIVATICNFFECVCVRPSDLVRAVSSKVIVAFSYYLVQMFIMLCRRVAYKTYDSISKVSVAIRGQS